eukprot:gene11958-13938_t
MNAPRPSQASSPDVACLRVGCNLARFQDYKFCGRTHGSETTIRTIPDPSGHFILQQINHNHKKYATIETQFQKSWKHPGAKGVLQRIYIVVPSKAALASYESYKTKVGNEQRRWHGTKSLCLIGADERAAPCTNPGCAVCNICRTSFSIFPGAKWNRFGDGVYFSATSSKSNDYIKSSIPNPNKVMFLCRVALGNPKNEYTDQCHYKAPPPGYNSVVGLPGQGLNYDEAVVYDTRACIPSYLIVFQ